MFGKLLCSLGLHNFRLSEGRGVSVEGNRRMAIFFSKDCQRCSKHVDAVIVA